MLAFKLHYWHLCKSILFTFWRKKEKVLKEYAHLLLGIYMRSEDYKSLKKRMHSIQKHSHLVSWILQLIFAVPGNLLFYLLMKPINTLYPLLFLSYVKYNVTFVITIWWCDPLLCNVFSVENASLQMSIWIVSSTIKCDRYLKHVILRISQVLMLCLWVRFLLCYCSRHVNLQLYFSLLQLSTVYVITWPYYVLQLSFYHKSTNMYIMKISVSMHPK